MNNSKDGYFPGIEGRYCDPEDFFKNLNIRGGFTQKNAVDSSLIFKEDKGTKLNSTSEIMKTLEVHND